jgi:hypothetical protein
MIRKAFAIAKLGFAQTGRMRDAPFISRREAGKEAGRG